MAGTHRFPEHDARVALPDDLGVTWRQISIRETVDQKHRHKRCSDSARRICLRQVHAVTESCVCRPHCKRGTKQGATQPGARGEDLPEAIVCSLAECRKCTLRDHRAETALCIERTKEFCSPHGVAQAIDAMR